MYNSALVFCSRSSLRFRPNYVYDCLKTLVESSIFSFRRIVILSLCTRVFSHFQYFSRKLSEIQPFLEYFIIICAIRRQIVTYFLYKECQTVLVIVILCKSLFRSFTRIHDSIPFYVNVIHLYFFHFLTSKTSWKKGMNVYQKYSCQPPPSVLESSASHFRNNVGAVASHTARATKSGWFYVNVHWMSSYSSNTSRHFCV